MLVQRSNDRIKNNPVFQRVNEYSDLLKENKDKTIFPLSYDEFAQSEDEIDNELKKYKKLYPIIETFEIQNLAVDLVEIQSDTTKSERNDRFIKALNKDAELEESLAILHDMIHLKQ